MKRLFLGSSVLFSALYSSRGFSRDLLLAAARGEIILVMSQDVVDETWRNLMEHAPGATHALWDYFFSTIVIEYVNPTQRDVRIAARHVAAKDTPIVAAARKAKVDCSSCWIRNTSWANRTWQNTSGPISSRPERPWRALPGRDDYARLFCSIFAQVSFNATARLKTGFSRVESGSAQK